jgi:hypothetical protein
LLGACPDGISERYTIDWLYLDVVAVKSELTLQHEKARRSVLPNAVRAIAISVAFDRTLIGSAGEAVRLHTTRIECALVGILPREERQPSRVALECSPCVALTLVHRAF